MYNKIINYLQHGYFVVLQNENDKFQVIASFKDSNENYRRSGWWYNLEDAKNYIGTFSGYTEKEIKEYSKNWTIVETFYFEPEKWFKAGDKVRIRENAEEIIERIDAGYWNNDISEMVGKVCEIKDKYLNYYKMYNEDKSFYWFFPPQALEPVLEEEEDKMQEAMDLLKENGYKITKYMNNNINNK